MVFAFFFPFPSVLSTTVPRLQVSIKQIGLFRIIINSHFHFKELGGETESPYYYLN